MQFSFLVSKFHQSLVLARWNNLIIYIAIIQTIGRKSILSV